MTSSEPDVLVIGAGVSGLTTAVCLAEAGAAVKISAAVPPDRTTSAAAGAIWAPHLVGMDDRVERWGATTLARLLELAAAPAAGPAAAPAAGVRMVTGRQVCRTVADPPGWAASLDGFRLCADGELPEGFASGWRFTAPVMTMPVYLGYLLARFRAADGELDAGGAAGTSDRADGRRHTFGSLDEAIASTTAGVIVNCSGIGARSLVPDAEMLPVRGQVVVTANPGITEFFIGLGDESAGLVYLFPHAGTVVLGGTEDRGSWRLEPDPATAERILRDAAAIEPRLRGAEIVAHRVGLRPVRPAVRLEAEDLAGGRTLVHNYGHGGAGVTLSWGCAADAAGLALGALGAPPRP
jgi:D-amino-acid oxidase